jgi:hypothetical protein
MTDGKTTWLSEKSVPVKAGAGSPSSTACAIVALNIKIASKIDRCILMYPPQKQAEPIGCCGTSRKTPSRPGEPDLN